MPPTNDEINAGFDAAIPELHSLVKQFVPWIMQSQAEQILASTEGRRDVVNIVTKVLAAAEKVRQAAQK